MLNSFISRYYSFGYIDLHLTSVCRHDYADDMETFQLACSILVDLSSIPTTAGKPYNFSSSVTALAVASADNSDASDGVSRSCHGRPASCQLSGWLVALCACTCSSAVTLQQAALAALLELLTLAHSDLSVWRDTVGGGFAPNGGEEGVLTVSIIPRIHPTHMHVLLHHTSLYQVTTGSSRGSCLYFMLCISLLHVSV